MACKVTISAPPDLVFSSKSILIKKNFENLEWSKNSLSSLLLESKVGTKHKDTFSNAIIY